MRSELDLATKLYAPSLSAFAPFVGPSLYQLPLKLNEPAQNREHQPPV